MAGYEKAIFYREKRRRVRRTGERDSLAVTHVNPKHESSHKPLALCRSLLMSIGPFSDPQAEYSSKCLLTPQFVHYVIRQSVIIRHR